MRSSIRPPQSETRSRSKYRNSKCEVDGVQFDSRKEAARWGELRTREAAGAIVALRRQVRIPIIVNGTRVCAYVADFVYIAGGRRVVEDVKSAFTRKLPVYRLKKKLLAALGVEINEV
ncbi:hypothetical protein VT84_03470 [Gemmata sp. SH-PL17]|uniref:DUF1064 domain-containing protein n=1 Tax=Gemmata sp. SH-PL17 TaxID=1630693 RepID=UPI00078D2FA6|nr:DUF1064 domain-containing protein [Gemmata sp. SH-PL17]AMV23443.1 hypothetical protein VT84_03470 [Gemmata sp. SH-PL17]